jgi:hypothetical protein
MHFKRAGELKAELYEQELERRRLWSVGGEAALEAEEHDVVDRQQERRERARKVA